MAESWRIGRTWADALNVACRRRGPISRRTWQRVFAKRPGKGGEARRDQIARSEVATYEVIEESLQRVIVEVTSRSLSGLKVWVFLVCPPAFI